MEDVKEKNKPVSKYVKGISNTSTFVWLRLFPNMDVLHKINKILKVLDRGTFGRSLFYEENVSSYEEFTPYSYPLNDGDDESFAICIAKNDCIDFIILKHAKSYEECFDLCKKEFEIF